MYDSIIIHNMIIRSVGHKQDLGCYSVPFASVELSHIIDGGSVILTPGVTFLVVSTDDEQWLDQQKEKLAITHPAWTVVHLRAPTFSGPTGRASKEYLRFLRHQSGTFLFGSGPSNSADSARGSWDTSGRASLSSSTISSACSIDLTNTSVRQPMI